MFISVRPVSHWELRRDVFSLLLLLLIDLSYSDSLEEDDEEEEPDSDSSDWTKKQVMPAMIA